MFEPAGSAELSGLAWHRLCAASELPTDGSGKVCEVAGQRLAVFSVAGRAHVLDDECPHEGASLGDGVVSQGEVTCPWHAFHFDLCTGRNADGLALEVRVHPARVREDGSVEVALRTAP